jgi:hypothetical protein
MPVMVLILFVGSCFGMGYFIGRRRAIQQSLLLIGVSAVCAAVVWPVLVIAFTVHTGRQYQPRGPSDPVDAPVMLLMSMLFVGGPILFAISLLLVVAGIVIARQKSKRDPQRDGAVLDE